MDRYLLLLYKAQYLDTSNRNIGINKYSIGNQYLTST